MRERRGRDGIVGGLGSEFDAKGRRGEPGRERREDRPEPAGLDDADADVRGRPEPGTGGAAAPATVRVL
jgi:hypothetical protein